jgi:hypothetical protein
VTGKKAIRVSRKKSGSLSLPLKKISGGTTKPQRYFFEELFSNLNLCSVGKGHPKGEDDHARVKGTNRKQKIQFRHKRLLLF